METITKLLDTLEEDESLDLEDMKLFKELEVKSSDDDEDDELKDNQFKVRATDISIDRHDDIILSDGVKVENYMKNPVVLDGHDTRKRVGKVVNIEKSEGEIIATIELDTDNPDEDKATKAESLLHEIKNGFLNAVSVGINPTEVEAREDGSGFLIKESELVEISLVTIPANRNALVTDKSFSGTDNLRKHTCNSIAKWFGSNDVEALRKAAQTILAITDHEDASLAKGALTSDFIAHKSIEQELKDELDDITSRAASDLSSLGNEVERQWREHIRDNPDARISQRKEALRQQFLPRYEDVMMERAQQIWEMESDRFLKELVEQGLLESEDDLELPEGTNFDRALRLQIESSAEEAINRELGNLQQQQIEITRQTPPSSDTPAGSVALETLALSTLATIASDSIAASLNSGRDRVMVAVEEQTDVTMKAVRNEVLDTNTCEACEELDGFEATYGTRSFYENSPPNKCDGRGRCRGFWDIEGDKEDPRHQERDDNASISKDETEIDVFGHSLDAQELLYELEQEDIEEEDPIDAVIRDLQLE